MGLYYSLVYFKGPTCVDGCPPLSDLIGKMMLFGIGFIISFIPIYVIWSFFDKKAVEKASPLEKIFLIAIAIFIILIAFIYLLSKFR